jgi:predicted neuraminidase
MNAAPSSPAVVLSEFIHEPGSYPQCHASTIAETPDGGLVAAWFGGTHERHPDVCIWLRRQADGHWLPETKVADGVQQDGTRYPCWNPVLFQPRDGPLLLFYKVGPSPSEWWGMLTTSADGGKTWSEPRRLPKDVLGPIKDKPIELADGSLLCGSSTEDPLRGWRVHLERTPDLGRTWQIVGPIAPAGFNAIQPTLLTHADGRLQVLCRTKEMIIATSWSSDQGRTWTPLAPSGLHAPNSGIDAVTLADGRQLLVYNHRDSMAPSAINPKSSALGTPAAKVRQPAEDWGVRWPLNVALSPDGVHWKMVVTLEDEPRKDGYAYPAVIQTHDGLVHITYTWGRVKIKHVVLDPRRL